LPSRNYTKINQSLQKLNELHSYLLYVSQYATLGEY